MEDLRESPKKDEVENTKSTSGMEDMRVEETDR
jgi:hypothetical protein